MYGQLYGDIALIELGRRILFDFEQFGDTPACLDTGLKLDGRLATIQVIITQGKKATLHTTER